ncbi:hypothetical protein AAVH_24889 [Aphelenchoides avenae]|nr:hypothetical protein AAVH_24889 [Aphelenchus avenae]
MDTIVCLIGCCQSGTKAWFIALLCIVTLMLLPAILAWTGLRKNDARFLFPLMLIQGIVVFLWFAGSVSIVVAAAFSEFSSDFNRPDWASFVNLIFALAFVITSTLMLLGWFAAVALFALEAYDTRRGREASGENDHSSQENIV